MLHVASDVRHQPRSLDTRNKFQLGGIVIPAGLDNEESAVLLGLLTLAAGALHGPDNDAVRPRFRRAGDQAFKAWEAGKVPVKENISG